MKKPKRRVIYGVQWQDYTEPWGWETSVHVAYEEEARAAYAAALAGTEGYMRASIRLVRIHVHERVSPEALAALASPVYADTLGVEEIAREERWPDDG